MYVVRDTRNVRVGTNALPVVFFIAATSLATTTSSPSLLCWPFPLAFFQWNSMRQVQKLVHRWFMNTNSRKGNCSTNTMAAVPDSDETLWKSCHNWYGPGHLDIDLSETRTLFGQTDASGDSSSHAIQGYPSSCKTWWKPARRLVGTLLVVRPRAASSTS